MPTKPITDKKLVNQLEGGHYAFKAQGADGAEVYIAWNDDFIPRKDTGEAKTGATEAARQKVTRSGGRGRDMAGVGQVAPGNVIGGQPGRAGEDMSRTLLGGGTRPGDLQTLLGGR